MATATYQHKSVNGDSMDAIVLRVGDADGLGGLTTVKMVKYMAKG